MQIEPESPPFLLAHGNLALGEQAELVLALPQLPMIVLQCSFTNVIRKSRPTRMTAACCDSIMPR